MGRELVGAVHDVHHRSRCGAVLAAELAVAEPEVQRRADHDDDVGLAERPAPGPGDELGVPARHDAATHPVGDHRAAERLRAPRGRLLGAAGPHVRAQHEHRVVRLAQRPHGGGQLLLVRLGVRRGLHRRDVRQGAAGEQHVHRDVDEHRSAVRRGGERERLVHTGGDGVDLPDGGGVLGDRREQRDVVHLLQAAAAPAPRRCAPAEEHDGGAVEVGGGHRRDRVGDTGSRGRHGEPRPARQLRGGLGGEDGGLLVPHVEQPQRGLELHRRVVHREHVRPGEGEHGADPVRRSDPRDLLPAVPLGALVVGLVAHGADPRTPRGGVPYVSAGVPGAPAWSRSRSLTRGSPWSAV